MANRLGRRPGCSGPGEYSKTIPLSHKRVDKASIFFQCVCHLLTFPSMLITDWRQRDIQKDKATV